MRRERDGSHCQLFIIDSSLCGTPDSTSSTLGIDREENGMQNQDRFLCFRHTPEEMKKEKNRSLNDFKLYRGT
jgi:hypothetical protein